MDGDGTRIRVGVGLDSLENVARNARDLEADGFDYLFCGEHVFFHGLTPNAFVTLAAAAGATSEIQLLSAIAILPLYPPPLIAKMATVLDHISEGRFNLGVGVGGEFKPEFDAVGVPIAERGRRTDEALEVLRVLSEEGPASFDGKYTQFQEVELNPPSPRPDGVPIWVAGRSEKAIRRAGRFADVWMPYMYTPEQFERSLSEVRQAAEESGRDPRAVDGSLYAFVCVDEDGELAWRKVIDAATRTYEQDFSKRGRYLIGGTPAECASRILEYADAGASSVQLLLGCEPEDEARVISLLKEQVLPLLRKDAGDRRETASGIPVG